MAQFYAFSRLTARASAPSLLKCEICADTGQAITGTGDCGYSLEELLAVLLGVHLQAGSDLGVFFGDVDGFEGIFFEIE